MISYKTQRRLASRLSWFSKLSSNNSTKCGNRGIVIQPKHLGNITIERTVFEELFKVKIANVKKIIILVRKRTFEPLNGKEIFVNND